MSYKLDSMDYVNGQGYVFHAKDDYPLVQTGDDPVRSAPVNIKTGSSTAGNTGSIAVLSGDALSGTAGSIFVQTGNAVNGGQIVINSQGTTPGPVTLQQNGANRIQISNTGGISLIPNNGQAVVLSSDGSNGLQFASPVPGYTAASLNYYEELPLTLSFTGAFSASVPAKIVRIGKMVTLTIQSTPALYTASGSQGVTAASGSIPSRFRAAGGPTTVTRVADQNVAVNGIISLPTNGSVIVQPTTGAFTNAAGAGWGDYISISYVV